MSLPEDGYPAALRDRFPPLRTLGEGGMGRVVLAEDPALDRRVAVKLLRETADTGRGLEMRQRFLREAEVMARVEHPNLVRLFHHGVVGVTPYLVMEYLEGRPPDATRDDALEVMLPIAAALEAIHQAGLVHRDVKPENILLTQDGRPVLIDFGLMKGGGRPDLTRTGALVGTVSYLPPEALDPNALSPATDFFAWGVSLYELLEGHLPFPREVMVQWLAGGAAPAPRFRAVDPDSGPARVVRACLAEDPEERPVTRAAVQDLLGGAGDRRGPTAPLPAGADAGPGPGKLPDTAPLASRPRASGSGPFPPASGAAPAPRSPVPRTLLGGWLALAAALAWWWWPRPTPAPAVPAAPSPASARAPALPPDLEPLEPGPEGVRRFRNRTDGSVLVELPRTRFRPREPGEVGPGPPGPELEVGPVLLAETEVTVIQYRKFLSTSGWREPLRWEDQLAHPRRPVVLLRYEDAVEYCGWAGGRLPTAAEWELGAGGARGLRYPWGDAEPHGQLAVFDRGDLTDVAMHHLGYLRPVGGRPGGASPFGLRDMVGNVAELSSTPARDQGDAHLTCGGAWIAHAERIRVGYKRPWPDSSRDPTVGLRLARDAPGAEG